MLLSQLPEKKVESHKQVCNGFCYVIIFSKDIYILKIKQYQKNVIKHYLLFMQI